MISHKTMTSEMTRVLSHSRSARLTLGKKLARRLRRLPTRELLIQAFFVSILTAVAILLAFPSSISYRVGETATSTIRADRGFQLEDKAVTEMQRQEAAAQVPPVFLRNDVLGVLLEEEAAGVFQRGRESFGRPGAIPSPAAEETRLAELKKLEMDFRHLFNVPPESKVWEGVVRCRFDQGLERQVLSLAMEIMSLGLMDRPNPFSGQRPQPAAIVTLSTQTEYVVPMAASLLDQASANRTLEVRSRFLKSRFNQEDINLILALVRGLIQPNLKPDAKETEKRIEEAKAAIPVSYFNIRAGEVLIREGAVITPEALEKIKQLHSPGQAKGLVFRFMGLFLALFVFFNASMLLSNLGPKGQHLPISVKDHAFITGLLLMVAFMAHSAHMFGASLAWDFDFLDSHTVFYAMPIPAATMLAAIFLDLRKAAFMALFAAVTAAVVSPAVSGGWFMAILYCYNGSITAAWCLRNMNERSQLIPATFWVVVVNCLTLLGLTFLGDIHWSRQVAYNFAAAAASGLLSGIAACGLIPIIEFIFGFSTNLRLLELGNLDRQMLRELMLSAPGTYHHSVIVGAMVEAAAEVIGANPHLAKVGAYYHDIGKMKKPLYFVENQSGENRHDTLAASMSALILIGHVREGAELARESGLPPSIIDIVQQHHGTSLMSFFYHKAQEQRQEGQPEINEGDYRYPGPRPRSQEAGLVMLADICEAATRSLSNPTPAKIKTMVRQLVNNIFADGQLDDCLLRTQEIAEVVNTFTTILTGIYHHRVAYPSKKGTPALKEAPSGRPPVESPKSAAA
ncbi:MAG: HDIG domain-containing protein [Candidatus Adiutrix sp.]|jgi:putative nucleotidyltransferase with HDIG domain|nr:HDIG domain-containing protein [Candidatus Adiutrix sp.]